MRFKAKVILIESSTPATARPSQRHAPKDLSQAVRRMDRTKHPSSTAAEVEKYTGPPVDPSVEQASGTDTAHAQTTAEPELPSVTEQAYAAAAVH